MGETLSKSIDNYLKSSEEILYDQEQKIIYEMRKIRSKLSLLERELNIHMQNYENACKQLSDPNKRITLQEFRYLYTMPIIRTKNQLKIYNKHLFELSTALAKISTSSTELTLLDTTNDLNTILSRRYPTVESAYSYQAKLTKDETKREIVQEVLQETYNSDNTEQQISDDEALLLETPNFFPVDLIRPNRKKENNNDINDNISLPSIPLHAVME